MSKQVSGARVVCTIPCTLMCVHLFYISASTLSTCMFLNHLVHQRVYIYFTFQHQLWACACMCINFFFNPYFPAEGWCLGNFLENNDASSIFCKSADEKEFSCSQKIQISCLSSNQRRASWVQVEERQLFKSANTTTPSLSNQREFSHRWWGWQKSFHHMFYKWQLFKSAGTTPNLSNQRKFSTWGITMELFIPLMRLVGKFSSYVLEISPISVISHPKCFWEICVEKSPLCNLQKNIHLFSSLMKWAKSLTYQISDVRRRGENFEPPSPLS